MSVPPRPVFLIGARGSGKTTVARLLAGQLGWEWVDLDAEVEAAAGRSVARIFREAGETDFRAREAKALAGVRGRLRLVVATGGGIVLMPENRRLLRETGVVVWLTGDAETLWERTSGDPGSAQRRPDLAGGGLDEMRQVLAAREALYRECASFAVSTAGRTPAELADEIAARLSEAAIEVPRT